MARSISLFVLCVATLAQTGCTTNPSTGRSQFLLVSGDQTTAMGIEAKPQLIEEYGGEHESAPLREYVARVGTRLLDQVEPEYTEVPWEFILLDSEVINAFALPGGKVFMTIGLMIRLRNEAQLAGVLGHEIGHVTALHVDERISQSVALEVGMGVLGAATESQLTFIGAQLFSSGYQLHFGRDQELESDRQGLKYMSRAGYDPSGLREVLEILKSAAGENRTPEFLSTHPDPDRRLRQVDRMLAEDYSSTQGNPAYGLYVDRFDRDARAYFPPAEK